MKNRFLSGGVLPLLAAAMIWGGMFAVASSVLEVMDAFHLTLVRNGSAALLFALILLGAEGRASFRFEGKGPYAFVFGALGFAGFSLLVFNGLGHTRPEHAAVIMATMPMLTAALNWGVRGARPAPVTVAAIAVAFAGVILVVSKGNAGFLHEGSIVGDVMILGGALCWVGYTMGAAAFPGWSSLRYTAVTSLAGAVAIGFATLGAIEMGDAHATSTAAIAAVHWQLGYMIVLATLLAVLAWNKGMKVLGPSNGVLFITFVPVTAFAIGFLRGHVVAASEVAGAALVVVALIVNNLWPRLADRLAARVQTHAVRTYTA